ncbi:unnamed protein product, partial [Prorocentrum cordatum]
CDSASASPRSRRAAGRMSRTCRTRSSSTRSARWPASSAAAAAGAPPRTMKTALRRSTPRAL